MGRLRAALAVVFGVLLVGLWGAGDRRLGRRRRCRSERRQARSHVGRRRTSRSPRATRSRGSSTRRRRRTHVTATSGNWTARTPARTAPERPDVVSRSTRPGTYTFVCDDPPGTMAGTVTVEDGRRPLENVLVFSKTAGFRHDSIPQGIAAIQALGAANGFTVTATEDAAAFTDANLAQYDVVVFLSTTGDVLDDAQQTAFENYIRAGGGYAGIHAAAGHGVHVALVRRDARRLLPQPPRRHAHRDGRHRGRGRALHLRPPGALDAHGRVVQLPAPGHARASTAATIADYSPRAAAGASPRHGRRVDLRRGRRQRRTDDDHPVAWCSDFDGGRSWYTAHGPHRRRRSPRPTSSTHLLGGLQTAGGRRRLRRAAPGPPVAADFEKVTLNDDTNAPMELDIANDGRAFYVELDGRVLRCARPANGQSRPTIGTIPVSLHPRERPDGHPARARLRRQPATSTSPTRRCPTRRRRRHQPHLALHGQRGQHDRPAQRAGHLHVAPPARGVLPHRRLAGLRARRQPLPVHGRQHQPVRVRRLQPDRRAPRPPVLGRAAHVGQHERPERQDPAHPRRSRTRRAADRPAWARTYTIPSGTCSPPGHGARRCPRSTRWASATRSGSTSTRRRAGC